MLDIRYLRDNPDEAEARLHTRGETVGLAPFRALDARRRTLLGESEALKAERNSVSALIGRTKDKSQVQGEMARMKEVSARVKELDETLRPPCLATLAPAATLAAIFSTSGSKTLAASSSSYCTSEPVPATLAEVSPVSFSSLKVARISPVRTATRMSSSPR